jgi:hypothetical protein
VINERPVNNEVATPTPGSPYAKATYPGRHDAAIVASGIIVDAAGRAHASGETSELENIAGGGRPDYWTERMEAQLGDQLPTMAGAAAMAIEQGDRNTTISDGVNASVDEARMAEQAAAYEASGGGKEDGVAGALFAGVTLGQMQTANRSVDEVDPGVEDGIIARMRAAKATVDPLTGLVVGDPASAAQISAPASAPSPLPARQATAPVESAPVGEVTRTLDPGSSTEKSGTEETRRLSAGAIASAFVRPNGVKHGVGEGERVIRPGGRPTTLASANGNSAPGEKTVKLTADTNTPVWPPMNTGSAGTGGKTGAPNVGSGERTVQIDRPVRLGGVPVTHAAAPGETTQVLGTGLRALHGRSGLVAEPGAPRADVGESTVMLTTGGTESTRQIDRPAADPSQITKQIPGRMPRDFVQ